MKNTIMNILAVAVLIGLCVAGYILIKDRKIKEELSGVERSEFVERLEDQGIAAVDSEINLTRTNGTWTASSTGDYVIDPATLKFEFTGYKPGGQHVGTFNNAKVDVALSSKGEPIGAVIILDAASAKTDTDAVTKHLQTADFFDAANNPQITVAIKGVETESDASLRAIADVTIKGTTKTLAIPVKVTRTETGMKFDVDTKIKISEYGIAYGPVQDDVRVVVSGELKRK